MRGGSNFRKSHSCSTQLAHHSFLTLVLSLFLLPVFCSSLSHQNTISFRKFLCPDLSCKMCKKTASEVQQLLEPDIKVDVSISIKSATRTRSYLHPGPSLSAASSGKLPPDLSLLPYPCSSLKLKHTTKFAILFPLQDFQNMSCP